MANDIKTVQCCMHVNIIARTVSKAVKEAKTVHDMATAVEPASSSSEKVKRALMEVINEKQLETPRFSFMLKTGRDILGKIEGAASNEAEPFSVELVEALQSCFDCAKRCRSIGTKKPKILTSFHQVQQEKLPSV